MFTMCCLYCIYYVSVSQTQGLRPLSVRGIIAEQCPGWLSDIEKGCFLILVLMETVPEGGNIITCHSMRQIDNSLPVPKT